MTCNQVVTGVRLRHNLMLRILIYKHLSSFACSTLAAVRWNVCMLSVCWHCQRLRQHNEHATQSSEISFEICVSRKCKNKNHTFISNVIPDSICNSCKYINNCLTILFCCIAKGIFVANRNDESITLNRVKSFHYSVHVCVPTTVRWKLVIKMRKNADTNKTNYFQQNFDIYPICIYQLKMKTATYLWRVKCFN